MLEHLDGLEASADTRRLPSAMNSAPTLPFRPRTLRDNRTYHVSDERLQAFGQLSYLQRLQWVEQCSSFVRLAQAAKQAQSCAHDKT